MIYSRPLCATLQKTLNPLSIERLSIQLEVCFLKNLSIPTRLCCLISLWRYLFVRTIKPSLKSKWSGIYICMWLNQCGGCVEYLTFAVDHFLESSVDMFTRSIHVKRKPRGERFSPWIYYQPQCINFISGIFIVTLSLIHSLQVNSWWRSFKNPSKRAVLS